MKNPAQSPVFIGGLAHSGKSQLRQVVSAHPNIAMTRRTYLWTKFYDRYGDLSRPQDFERCLTALLRDPGVQQLEPDPERVRREFSEGARTYARLFGLLHAHHALQLGKPRWGDQLGMIEQYADPIFSAFPGARMIHLIRDPRLRLSGNGATGGRRRGTIGWETARWLHSVELARRNQQEYERGYLVMTFEDLAAHPEQAVARVFAFLDETFSDAARKALSSITFGSAHDESPAADLSGRGVAETDFIQMYGGYQLRDLGYPETSNERSRLRRARFLVLDWPVLRGGMAAWRLTNRSRAVGT